METDVSMELLIINSHPWISINSEKIDKKQDKYCFFKLYPKDLLQVLYFLINHVLLFTVWYMLMTRIQNTIPWKKSMWWINFFEKKQKKKYWRDVFQPIMTLTSNQPDEKEQSIWQKDQRRQSIQEWTK